MSKNSASKSRARLIYWLLFAPFVLVPVSIWILEGYGAISTVALWSGLGLEIASIIGFFIGLFMLSVLPANTSIFRSKRIPWPATLLFLIPLILLTASLFVFLPGEKPPLVITELLLLRTIALASAAIGAILTFQRIKPRKTAWLMVSLAAIPYLLIIIASYATSSPQDFDNLNQIHRQENLNLAINFLSAIIGLVVLIIGWFWFRKKG